MFETIINLISKFIIIIVTENCLLTQDLLTSTSNGEYSRLRWFFKSSYKIIVIGNCEINAFRSIPFSIVVNNVAMVPIEIQPNQKIHSNDDFEMNLRANVIIIY